MYGAGEGAPQDYSETVVWLRKAADQGYAEAQFKLGWAYENGYGVREDHMLAAMWWREAADQGNADAQIKLAWLYENGDGIQQDCALAYLWLNWAAAHTSNVVVRQAAIKQRDEVAAKMTPDQIAEAQRLASEWKPK
jgi:TPR repeat protein